MELRKAVWILVLLLWVAGCGKPVEPQAPSQRGEVVGSIEVPPGLKNSRLVSAGCVQVVKKNQGMWAEFSHSDCPEPRETLLPAESTVFELLAVQKPGENLLELKMHENVIGFANGVGESGGDFSVWNLVHLCQISDPDQPAVLHFSELCEVVFETLNENQMGRYRQLQLRSLEQVAKSKIHEIERLKSKDVATMKRFAFLERELELGRKELDRARRERQLVREALADAQRGVRDSIASNFTVNRLLERQKLEVELKEAVKDAKFYEVSIRLAGLEKERAALLRKSLDNSELAKSREEGIRKQLQALREQGGVDSEEGKKLQAVFDQNHALILSEAERRKVEESLTFSTAEAERVKDLIDRAAKVNRLIIDKKDELDSFDRQPPPASGKLPTANR